MPPKLRRQGAEWSWSWFKTKKTNVQKRDVRHVDKDIQKLNNLLDKLASERRALDDKIRDAEERLRVLRTEKEHQQPNVEGLESQSSLRDTASTTDSLPSGSEFPSEPDESSSMSASSSEASLSSDEEENRDIEMRMSGGQYQKRTR